MFQVVRYGDATSFLAAAAPVLAQDPVGTNVIGSVAAAVRDGRGYDSELWLVVHDDAGSPIGLAMRTAPHYLVVSQMPAGAAVALAAAVAELGPDLPGVSGPVEVAAEVVAAVLADRPGYRAVEQLRESVMVLGALKAPARSVSGHARPVGADDAPTVVKWMLAFAAEAGLPTAPNPAALRAELAQGHANLWLWTDPTMHSPDDAARDAPVALVGHAPVVITPAGVVARIGPVYTPPANRCRGYATALTHWVAAELVATGATVMLYVDTANPQAGHIYSGLGFQPAGEIVEIALLMGPPAR